jgi:hypothetical protein
VTVDATATTGSVKLDGSGDVNRDTATTVATSLLSVQTCTTTTTGTTTGTTTTTTGCEITASCASYATVIAMPYGAIRE